MYRLCGYVPGTSGVRELDRSEFEEDIIQTLGEYMSRNPEAGYNITIRTPEQDISYQTIFNFQDYINYLEQYEGKQKVKRK